MIACWQQCKCFGMLRAMQVLWKRHDQLLLCSASAVQPECNAPVKLKQLYGIAATHQGALSFFADYHYKVADSSLGLFGADHPLQGTITFKPSTLFFLGSEGGELFPKKQHAAVELEGKQCSHSPTTYRPLHLVRSCVSPRAGVMVWEDGRPAGRKATLEDLLRHLQAATLHIRDNQVVVELNPLCGNGEYGSATGRLWVWPGVSPQPAIPLVSTITQGSALQTGCATARWRLDLTPCRSPAMVRAVLLYGWWVLPGSMLTALSYCCS